MRFVFEYLKVHGADARCRKLRSLADLHNLLFDLWFAPGGVAIVAPTGPLGAVRGGLQCGMSLTHARGARNAGAIPTRRPRQRLVRL